MKNEMDTKMKKQVETVLYMGLQGILLPTEGFHIRDYTKLQEGPTG